MTNKIKINIKLNSAIAISQYVTETYQVFEPIRLQKLLFFLTLESLKQRDCLLFDESFEAWIYGPVVPEVYYYYRDAKSVNFSHKNLSFIKKFEDQKTKEFIDNNIQKYLKFSTIELRNWAHEATPWIKARDGYDEKERGRKKIKINTLRAFAKSKNFDWETFRLEKDNHHHD